MTLQSFWSSSGSRIGAAEAAEACRKLTAAELRLLLPWIPHANPGSSTAVKCDRAREIVNGVLVEKNVAP